MTAERGQRQRRRPRLARRPRPRGGWTALPRWSRVAAWAALGWAASAPGALFAAPAASPAPRAASSKPAANAAAVDPETGGELDRLLNEIEALSSDPETLRRAFIGAIEAMEERARRDPAAAPRAHGGAEALRGMMRELLGPEPAAADSKPAAPGDPKSPAPGPGALPAVSPDALAPAPAVGDLIAPEADAAFVRRFGEEIWPLLTTEINGATCATCHGADTKTPLALLDSPEATFHRMLRQGYFDPENPDSALARISAPKPEGRMPPAPTKALPQDRVEHVRRFVDDLYQARTARGAGSSAEDERFPAELNAPYVETAAVAAAAGAGAGKDGKPEAGSAGAPALAASARAPNASFDGPFLSYHQLRRKVALIFGDEWTRDGRDLFLENIAQFGGADFQRHFSESAKPSATFMAALDQMAADMVSKAFLNGSGPFKGLALPAAPPLNLASPPADYAGAIAELYRRLLYREPMPEETLDSFRFVRSIFEEELTAEAIDAPLGGDQTLDFELTARGKLLNGEPGPATRRRVSLLARDDTRGYFQTSFSQNRNMPSFVWRERVGGRFPFRAGDGGQSVTVANLGSRGIVTFAGVEIVGPLPLRTRRLIAPDDARMLLEGPWLFAEMGKLKFAHDGDENKGQCAARARIEVATSGLYEVYVRWTPWRGKKGGRPLADKVFVQVVSRGGPTRLTLPDAPARPPKGEAHFFIDETIDAIPFVDLDSVFRFEAPEHSVAILNAGTSKRVTADAVTFTGTGGAPDIQIDNPAADGKENWPIYTEYPFRPYNIVGPDCVSDQNKRKGELNIGFTPAKNEKLFKKDAFYGARVIYPGQVDNDTHVPVVVKAAESSPIVIVRAPVEAPLNAEAVIDASGTYDIQGSEIAYEWRQVGGPAVAIDDPTSSTIRVRTGRPGPAQRAWEGLARALMGHPDFVFTRAPSLRRGLSPADRNRLLLVKVAQDLVARPPNADELARADGGATLEQMIDAYLESPEFADFYFRRVRLYLESHGTPEEDEPARLWTRVALNDLPFQEILTADYTVNEKLEALPRPAYHGRTGLLTMPGFIKGKPGLPHFNYAAQVAEKFLGYVFEVPPEIVEQREGLTAISTTNPGTVCYSCHKTLTPLAFQRLHWDDNGVYRTHDERGAPLDASDQGLAPTYPYRGDGMEAFAAAAQKKERFIRTMIDTHVNFYFGRSMRWDKDERGLYRKLWDAAEGSGFKIKAVIRAIMTSPEYLGGGGAEEKAGAPGPGKQIEVRKNVALGGDKP